MVLPIFVGCFIGRAHDGRGVHNAYLVVTRLLGCIILFCFGNVLSALLAKIMATHFHKDAHFSKMNDALQKVTPPPPQPYISTTKPSFGFKPLTTLPRQ